MNPQDAYIYSPFTGAKLEQKTDTFFYDPKSKKEVHLRPAVASDVAIIVDNELLLVERGKDPEKGTLNLPGGFCELGETFEDMAIREIQEETGIELEKDQLTDFKSYNERYLFQEVNEHVIVGRFICRMDEKPTVEVADDAASFEWVNLENIDYSMIFSPHRRFIKDLAQDT